MSGLTNLYQTVLRGTLLAPWEKNALCPSDIARTPTEVKSRERVAEVLRSLRREEPPLLDTNQVLEELQRLVLDQTKSLNCFESFTQTEKLGLEFVVYSLTDWSRLVKLLGQVREISMKRYNEEQARLKQARRLQQEQEDAQAA